MAAIGVTGAPAAASPIPIAQDRGARASFSRLLERALPSSQPPLAAARGPVETWIWHEPFRAARDEPIPAGGASRAMPAAADAAGRAGPSPDCQIELAVTRDLGVTLSRTDAGVAVAIEARPFQAAHVEADLPRIVRALRARGITVARASVRATRRTRAR